MPAVYIPPHRRRILTGETNLPSQEVLSPCYTSIGEQGDIGDLEPVGKWMILCDYINQDQDGLTELDRIWNVAEKLCKEGVFIKVTCFTAAHSGKYNTTNFKVRLVTCFVPNWKDIEHIILSASELRKRCIDYPYPLYFKTHRRREGGSSIEVVQRYLYCVDSDLYENFSENNFWKWKLVSSIGKDSK